MDATPQTAATKPTIWNQRNGYLLITWPDGRQARIRALRTKRGRRKETLVEIHAAEAKIEREK